MKIIDPGHVYEVDSVDGNFPQTIQFVKREGAHYPGNVGSHPGTQIQELLRVCIDRLYYVNNQIYAPETVATVNLLLTAVMLLEIRAKRVKGKPLDNDISYHMIDQEPTCKTCGHVRCTEHNKE